MAYHFYRKIKPLFSYMHCGYIHKDAIAITKHWHQNICFLRKSNTIVTPKMFTLFVTMKFNFYSKVKLIFSYNDYGCIEKDTTDIRKNLNQNIHPAVLRVCL